MVFQLINYPPNLINHDFQALTYCMVSCFSLLENLWKQ